MADAKDRWNQIYAKKSHHSKASAVLTRNVNLVQSPGLALDIACGEGANALFLADLGMTVDAWDISTTAIENLTEQAKKNGADIEAKALDITPDLLQEESYDLILNCHYLDRTLFPAIKLAIKLGGLLIFQTFTANKLADIGPKNPAFLLKQDELLVTFSDFDILIYQDESQSKDTKDPLCGRACLIAKKTKVTLETQPSREQPQVC